MAVSEATMREWAEVISENDFHEELINPNNGRSDAEMLARLMRAEEDNLDALAGVAQELLNRKRYRSVFGGDEMTWDAIGNYSTPWGSWREVIYADGQFSPIDIEDGAYNNHLANPMEIKAGENVATAPITSAWAKACELAYELTTMNTMYKSRINESTLVNDQLFHRGIGGLDTDVQNELREIFDMEPGQDFSTVHGQQRDSGSFDGMFRHSILILGGTVFFNEDDATNGNDICNNFIPKTGVGGENNTGIATQTASDFIDFLKSRVPLPLRGHWRIGPANMNWSPATAGIGPACWRALPICG